MCVGDPNLSLNLKNRLAGRSNSSRIELFLLKRFCLFASDFWAQFCFASMLRLLKIYNTKTAKLARIPSMDP